MHPLPVQRMILCLAAAAWFGGTSSLGAVNAPVSFDRDVMAVLSKAGCNLGACHGNLNGKGGFKLSLRGEDPAADYAVAARGRPISGG